ncbi:DNA polymerase III subunit beta [Candidatus Epulonipiscium fishelsonii]|uniref:DNA polymerase III subunit beta n=1 Tax=Candidatus Epulonipiscium fishelsonii TaxID=77094 RepID=A0ACC8X7I8_9FIRM|nr:DNA polymerase III subunit beta [Epulopiscium sp. SCG-B11WGA-EpuloA1]ONI41479.1 DNA polymerase III subunit beta [Epulopiscium sp. SCG-B05WGA-EpuloA1]
MLIYCEQELLINSINIVLKACSTKNTIPILGCIYLKAEGTNLTLIGNNLELGIESTLNAHILKEGSIAIESKIFSEIIKKMPNDEIELSLDEENNTVTITCKNSTFVIKGNPGIDFPDLPKLTTKESYTLPQSKFKEMIKQTIFSISQEELKPTLNGELLELKDNIFKIVAVDGFRMAYRQTLLTEPSISAQSAIVPGKTLTEIGKILANNETPVTIYFEKNHIMFEIDNSKIVSRLLDGEFLKYDQIFLDNYQSRVRIDKHELLLSLERTELISREAKNSPAKLEITNNSMLVSSEAERGNVREELNIELEGEELTIAFNPKYLIDALRAIEDQTIIIDFLSPLSPCIIHVEEGNYKYLILPVRINL